HQERVEIAVERDDLSGDEDQIELSLRVYKDGVVDRMPVVPSLVLDMKDEKDIWRLSQITVALHVPLSDPDYVKGIAEDMRKARQQEVEFAAISSLRAMVAGQTARQKNSRNYACNTGELGVGVQTASGESGAIDDVELAGKKLDYTYKIIDC